MSGQGDGVSVVDYLLPTTTENGRCEYFIIKAVRFHIVQFVRKHLVVFTDEVVFIFLGVGKKGKTLHTIPSALLQVGQQMSGYTAPALTVLIDKIDVRNAFMVLETRIYTAYESADVETYTEAEQTYRQSHNGDEVLRFVL